MEAKTSTWLRELEETCSPLCIAGIKTLILHHQQLIEARIEAEAQLKLMDRKAKQMESIY